MQQERISTGRDFWRSIFVLQLVSNVTAVVFILAYLWPALNFTSAQLLEMAAIVGLLVLLVMPPYGAMFHRWCAPVIAYLRAPDRRAVPERERVAAFAIVLDLPRRQFAASLGMWLSFGFPASAYLHRRFDDFSLDSTVVLCAAITSGGLLSSVIGFFAVKKHLEAVRTQLAMSLPDPVQRRAAVHPVSVRAKLFVSTSGLILVTLIFGVSVTNVRGKAAIEDFVTGAQTEVLLGIREQVRAGEDLDEVLALAADSRTGVVRDFVVVDLEAARSGSHLDAVLGESELRAILERPEGVSTGIDTPNGFAWIRDPLRPELAIVAVLPLNALGRGFLEAQGAFFLLIGVALAAAVLIARFVAADFGAAIDALRGELRSIADGDLRTREVYESEDDLGDLARSVQAMTQSLRRTIRQVVAAAERVESTADSIEGAASDVNEVATEQAQSIQSVSAEMDQVSLRARDISSSAGSLSASVEDSSSAILELSSVGEELHRYTADLSDRVDNTASSVALMTENIREVAHNAHRLSETATASVDRAEEMARGSNGIEESSSRTESLYGSVIETAKQGALRVAATVSGMQDIRRSVEDASRVVGDLAQRTDGIREVVTVINDIADRTSLLALNAAIIAAKAGVHGRPFAVVAAEIKALAEQVRKKTQEIDEVASAITEGASRAVDYIELGTESVEQGVALSTAAGEALDAITSGIQASGERIHEIVSAVREQSKTAGEVAGLIGHLNEEFGRIRAASDEEARHSERMRDLGAAIREIAQSVHRGAEEQKNNATHLAGGMEAVSDSTRRIDEALLSQTGACDQVLAVLELMLGRNAATEASGRKLETSTRELLAEAVELRTSVMHFELEDSPS